MCKKRHPNKEENHQNTQKDSQDFESTTQNVNMVKATQPNSTGMYFINSGNSFIFSDNKTLEVVTDWRSGEIGMYMCVYLGDGGGGGHS